MSAIEDRDPVAKILEANRTKGSSPIVHAAFGEAQGTQSFVRRTDVHYRPKAGAIVRVGEYVLLEPGAAPSVGGIRRINKSYGGTILPRTPGQALDEFSVPHKLEPVRGDAPEVPDGVDPAWAALGWELGFLPAWNDDAVLEYINPTYPGFEGVNPDPVERVKVLRSRLAEGGRSGFTVSMVVPRLPADITDPIFAAGAYIIEVRDDFWSLDAAGRIQAYRELIPSLDEVDDFPDLTPASALARRDRVPDLYSERNPLLSEEDVQDWRLRVSESARSD